jgi:hypothetical protein
MFTGFEGKGGFGKDHFQFGVCRMHMKLTFALPDGEEKIMLKRLGGE